jgi:aspartyl-tRNA(Asn)/glutamyl-tRNA(Gln) amidotransferase subunit C
LAFDGFSAAGYGQPQIAQSKPLQDWKIMIPNDSSNADFTIDSDTVKHVAFLVRLGIREEEAQAFSHQFSSIIDYFHMLNEVETSAVPPACETSNTHSVMRADEVQPSMPREDFLKNVPRRDGDFVQVPLVFEEE